MAKAELPAVTERQILAQVVDCALAFGVRLERSNTGGAVNPSGRLVMFGVKGDPDLKGEIPWAGGRSLRVECKRPGFDPAKLRGAKRAHFDTQLGRMAVLNARGGVAFWLSDVRDLVRALEILRDDPGASVTFDADGHPRFTYKEA